MKIYKTRITTKHPKDKNSFCEINYWVGEISEEFVKNKKSEAQLYKSQFDFQVEEELEFDPEKVYGIKIETGWNLGMVWIPEINVLMYCEGVWHHKKRWVLKKINDNLVCRAANATVRNKVDLIEFTGTSKLDAPLSKDPECIRDEDICLFSRSSLGLPDDIIQEAIEWLSAKYQPLTKSDFIWSPTPDVFGSAR